MVTMTQLSKMDNRLCNNNQGFCDDMIAKNKQNDDLKYFMWRQNNFIVHLPILSY